MSLFGNLFGSKSRGGGGLGPAELGRRLSDLETQAEAAQPGYKGMPLNKAGDLCLDAGDQKQALTYYGRAIDQLLEDGQREAARGVANKIIRIHAGAVRTLCTLTWLDLAAHHSATALAHLRDYVEAAKRSGVEKMARDQIIEMAWVASDDEFVDAAADALDLLGFASAASDVRNATPEERTPIDDPEELSAACVEAAVNSNMSRNREDLSF